MTCPAPAFARPQRFGAAEWEARVQLAAAYRIFDHLGWTELIYNHLSLRVPGEHGQFLVNPFGLHYSEVTASNLVKVDVRRQHPRPQRLADQPGRLHLPRRHPRHAARRALRDARAHHADDGGVLPRRRPVASPTSTPRSCTARWRTTSSRASPCTPTKGARILASAGGKPVLLLRNHGPVVIGQTLPQAFA